MKQYIFIRLLTLALPVFFLSIQATNANTITGGDYGGADLQPANGDTLSGTFTNVGRFLVPAGVTVYVAQGVPLEIHTGCAVIEGVIDGTGAGFAGGATNPLPGNPGVAGLPGGGPGGGPGGSYGPTVHGNGGSGGGYGNTGGRSTNLFGNGPPPEVGGAAYGMASPPGIQMGSGGGAGANFGGGSGGGPGGNGGGSVAIYAINIYLSGSILVDGQDGFPELNSDGSAGGGGSGGGILLDAQNGTIVGTLSTEGGNGGNAASGGGFKAGGGGGAGGRVKLEGNLCTNGATVVLTGGTGGTEMYPSYLPSTTLSTPGGTGTQAGGVACANQFVTAQNACSFGPPIPTMGQWGLFLFGLILLILVSVSLYTYQRSVIA